MQQCHLASVPEAGPHDYSTVAVFLVVVVDLPDREHPGVLLRLVGLGVLGLGARQSQASQATRASRATSVTANKSFTGNKSISGI